MNAHAPKRKGENVVAGKARRFITAAVLSAGLMAGCATTTAPKQEYYYPYLPVSSEYRVLKSSMREEVRNCREVLTAAGMDIKKKLGHYLLGRNLANISKVTVGLRIDRTGRAEVDGIEAQCAGDVCALDTSVEISNMVKASQYSLNASAAPCDGPASAPLVFILVGEKRL